jgi:hypothetical protein
MNDSEDTLKRAPSIQPDPARLEAATLKALDAFQRQHARKRTLVPFVASFLGAAAALVIAFILWTTGTGGEPTQPTPPAQMAEGSFEASTSSDLSRVEIIRVYAELRATFSEGLAGIVFVEDELRIYPGQVGEGAVEPTYMEMRVGDTRVRVVAAQGSTLPVLIEGATVSLEFMPDIDGLPLVSGEDFYWSSGEQYLPMGREILEVARLEVLR